MGKQNHKNYDFALDPTKAYMKNCLWEDPTLSK